MKTFKISLLFIAILSMCLQSCVKDTCEMEITYTQYNPISVSYTHLTLPTTPYV